MFSIGTRFLATLPVEKPEMILNDGWRMLIGTAIGLQNSLVSSPRPYLSPTGLLMSSDLSFLT